MSDEKKPVLKGRAGRIIRLSVLIVCALVFVVSASVLARDAVEYKRGEDTYKDIEQGALITDDMPTELEDWGYLRLDFDKLRATNAHFVAWLDIPDTDISYPCPKGWNNEYYLSFTFDHQRNGMGAIFFDTRCTGKIEGTAINLIYGHRMNNGSMFGRLNSYEKESFYNSHRYINLYNEKGVHVYKVFSVCTVPVTSDAFAFRISDKSDMLGYFERMSERSIHPADTEFTGDGNIITLVTCIRGDTEHAERFLVSAILERIVEYPEYIFEGE